MERKYKQEDVVMQRRNFIGDMKCLLSVLLCLVLVGCAALENRGAAPALAGVGLHLLAQSGQEGALLRADLDGRRLLVAPRVWISGNAIVSVRKVTQQASYQPAIVLQLDEAGKRRLAQMTGRNLGKQMALLAPDGQVVFVGEIQSAIDTGRLMFAGMTLARQQQIYQLLVGDSAR